MLTCVIPLVVKLNQFEKRADVTNLLLSATLQPIHDGYWLLGGIGAKILPNILYLYCLGGQGQIHVIGFLMYWAANKIHSISTCCIGWANTIKY
jgi:hypothetical protein